MEKASLDERISILLKNLSFENLKKLFWQELNYDRRNEVLQISEPSPAVTKDLQDNPILFATAGANDEFHIIYIRFSGDKLLLTSERAIINKLTKNHPYCLYVFSNYEQNLWHFVNTKLPENEKDTDNPIKRKLIRRIVIGKDENLKTAISRIAMLEIGSDKDDLFSKQSALSIQKQHDDAFNVDKVTKQFYEGYKAVFDILWKDLIRQSNDTKWGHDYALQFLNRLMFLYFIQRKRWMDNEPEWITGFFNAYRKANLPQDRFVPDWLNDLFFFAFNDKKIFDPKRNYPPEILNALHNAPYLNGGLFEENHLDLAYKHKFIISDLRFKQILDFLNSYNFTVREDSPLDQEVAVDAEMLGKVYESLVNVSTEIDERGEAGIFYTQRIEIDLMSRLSIVDNLANNLGNEHKNLFYEFVFAMDSYEKTDADRQITEKGLWEKIYSHLKNIAVVDPACGSGAFLVGMLLVIDDLIERSEQGLHELDESFQISSAYERRKQTICNSLFGVDVMQWAVEIAELRLWLQLVIETDIPQIELQNKPLLPKLSFKIRRGDSLVQPVPSIYDVVRKLGFRFTRTFQERRNKLEEDKAKFYNNELPEARAMLLETEELNLYRRGFEEIVREFEERIFEKNNSLNDKTQNSFGEMEYTLSAEKRKQLQREIVQDEKALAEYHKHKNYVMQNLGFFTWDKDFSEVFQKGKEGFDVVIGNPPYVRQEMIADPKLNINQDNAMSKIEYKKALADHVYSCHANYFLDNNGKNIKSISSKSDLYIYFYFLGLSLLNHKGSFSFITSNSWLDVGYGAALQEYLIRNCHIRYIIDNKYKRSFDNADVNTIITLFSAPMQSPISMNKDNRRALFVNFLVGFEEIMSSVIFEELEQVSDRKTTLEYHAHGIRNSDLLQEGMNLLGQYNEDSDDEDCPEDNFNQVPSVPHFIGDKWGGKYLKAPDIYWTIIEKGKTFLEPLGKNSRVRRGFTSGANKFFYLDAKALERWKIEAEFLRPVIVSPRESTIIELDEKILKYKLFTCSKSKNELTGTNALEYINWGEEQGYHKRTSVTGKQLWYSSPLRVWGKILFPMIHNDRHVVFQNGIQCAVDHNLFEIISNDFLATWSSLYWSGQILFRELYGRTNLGQGALKTEGTDIKKLLVFRLMDAESSLLLKPHMDSILSRPMKPIRDELRQPDRLAFDKVLNDILGLSDKETEAMYAAIIDLVYTRAIKADGAKKNKATGIIDAY